MTIMNNQLQMLEVDYDDALRDLGRVSRSKNKTQEEYAIYFERQDRCNICEAKVHLMQKIMNRITDMFGPQTPMLKTSAM